MNHGIRGFWLVPFVCLLGTARSQAPLSWRADSGVQYQLWPYLALDEARDRVVLVGIGRHAGIVHEWDGRDWLQRTRPGGPAGLDHQAVCYDARRREVVVFGSTVTTSSTFTWNGDAWRDARPAVAPSPRLQHQMVYDPVREVVVLFGGGARQLGGMLGDTWLWDGATWRQFPGGGPPPRQHHAMAFDRARGVSVVFGGNGDTSQWPFLLGDTWTFDGSVWRPQAGPGPAPRFGCAMAWDPSTQRTTLFGGTTGAALLADTWEWDGGSWRQVATTSAPDARAVMAMTAAPGGGRPLLFGGSDYPADAGSAHSDLWQRDSTGWAQVHGDATPGSRSYTAMAYDLARGTAVLFGGATRRADTWERRQGRWLRRNPPLSPPGRGFAAMTFDLARARVVLFGGVAISVRNDTWTWDGATWRETVPATRPPAREIHGLAWDPVAGACVLFGGQDGQQELLDDTWLFDGVDWRQVAGPGPGARALPAMTTDLVGARVVMFGGTGPINGGRQALGDTWIWTGSAWSALVSPVSPPPRVGAMLAAELQRGRLVLHGGAVGPRQPLRGDTWFLTGNTWAPGAIAGAGAMADGQLVWHVADEQFVGGFAATSPPSADLTGAFVVSAAPLATDAPFGTGCGRAPTLAADTAHLGREIALELSGTIAGAPVVFAQGWSRQSTPLPGGCTQLVAPVATQFAVANQSGVANTPIGLPWQPSLRGLTLQAQAVALDGGSPFAGLSLSRGLQFVIGD